MDRTLLAAHIRAVYQANADARNVVTERIRAARLAADMEYDPSVIAKINSAIGGSLSYYPVTRIKAKSASAWLQKILTSAEKPWSITPTPDPDLDDDTVNQIAAAAFAEQQRVAALGLEMEPDDFYEFATDMRNLIMQSRNARASDAAARAETLIADQLAEADFETALDTFLDDFCLYPTAFLRSVVRLDRVSRVTTSVDPKTGEEVVARVEKISPIRHFERVSPVRVFPAAGMISPDDGNLVIVSCFSLAEIADLATVPGYSAAEIRELVAEQAALASAPDALDDPLDAFPEAKLYSSDNAAYRRSGKLAALEFYGRATGKQIREWCFAGAEEKLPTETVPGMDNATGQNDGTGDGDPWRFGGTLDASAAAHENGAEMPPKPPVATPAGNFDIETLSDDQYYDIYAITIHDRCVYCRIAANEPRWIFAASFDSNPDSIWGFGLADILKEVQRDANSTRRAIINNLNLASYPQVIINDDAMNQLVPNSGGFALVPGHVWHTRPTFSGSLRPVDFIDVPCNYQSLAAEFERTLILSDRVSGIPEYSQGLSIGARNGAAGTASGLSMLLEAAGNQIKKPIANIDKGLIQPLIKIMYHQLLDDPTVSNDAKGDFKIVALGANGLMFKEQRAQRRRDFLQLVLASPVLLQLIKPEGLNALVRAVADTLDMETDKLLPNHTDLQLQQAQQAQLQQMQMQQQQMGGQQGQPPADVPSPEMPPEVMA